jgi:lipoprotein-anchoring transpeptidase ErfK/SrfK
MNIKSRLLALGCLLQLFLFALAADAAPRAKAKAAVPAPPAAAVANDAANAPVAPALGTNRSAVLRVQVLLDRARFSPGEIDARYGGNTKSAVAAFNLAKKLGGGPEINAATWQTLNLDTRPVVVPYTLTAEDVAGPFAPIPVDVADQAKLPALGFESLAEALGERFHVSPALLAALNPGTAFDRAGTVVLVPNVERPPFEKVPDMVIRVSRRHGAVEAIDGAGVVLARYPATIGSTHDPLPLGTWKVNGVSWNPPFSYNPDLFWDAESDAKATKLSPGPNGPVGTVWIDLSKPHYGIHGTSSPSTISKGTSHGCIRLTNWDATELAQMVTPGMSAILEK